MARPGQALRTPRQLLQSLLANPWGQLSPSVYETARLVSLAPWLSRHDARVEFLLARALPDGSFGGPGAYGLVPALSAAEGLLAELARGGRGRRQRLVRTVDRALGWLRDALVRTVELPDTPAVEVLVPVLIDTINERLAAGPRGLTGGVLPYPRGVDASLASALRHAIATGAALPEKALHALEIAGLAAGRAAVRLPVPGTVGASPASTAAWLAGQDRRDAAALAYLEGAVGLHGGPVSSVLPITMFERAWVLDSLHRGGVRVRVPARLLASLTGGLGATGTPGGAGLPCDADTTSITLLAAHRLGRPVNPAVLRHYETATHFVTWSDERTASTTTNAHVLECLGAMDEAAIVDGVMDDGVMDERRVNGGPPRAWRRRTIVKVARWLREQQSEDGTWADKWHASPLYATAAVTGALRSFGGRTAVTAVSRAVRWTLRSQHDDGSWGIWGGTAEETAYALHLLVPVLTWPGAPRLSREAVAGAAARGLRYLRSVTGSPEMPAYAPLWHDKDLYTPIAVVEAAVVSALHLAGSDRTLRAVST